jgi:hypothetical protein
MKEKIKFNDPELINDDFKQLIDDIKYLVLFEISNNMDPVIKEKFKSNENVPLLFYSFKNKKYFVRYKNSDLYKVSYLPNSFKAFHLLAFDTDYVNCLATTDNRGLQNSSYRGLPIFPKMFLWNLANLLNSKEIKRIGIIDSHWKKVNKEFDATFPFAIDCKLSEIILQDKNKDNLSNNNEIWDIFEDEKPFIKKSFNESRTHVIKHTLVYQKIIDHYEQ